MMMNSESIDHFTLSLYKQLDKTLKIILDGSIRPGDVVYCTKELNNVIFLKPPSEESIKKYQQNKLNGEKYPPFTGFVKYKTTEGKIRSAPVACIVKISSGNYVNEYEFKGENYQIISKNKEILARQAGFRTEVVIFDNSILLKIYGDTQEEVDDFITLVCNNDFQIY